MSEQTITPPNNKTFAKQSLLKPKLKAATYHFGISLAAFIILLYFLFFEWYPSPFFTAAGGWQGLQILIAVDLVLGPLLTLIIFNPKKSRKALVFDFSCIGIAQISAMVLGIYNIYTQHTAAIVFWDKEFYSVPYKFYQQQNISKDELKQYSDRHPPLIYAQFPRNKDEVKLVQSKAAEGIPAFAVKDIYYPIDSYYEDVLQNNLDIQEIMSTNEIMKSKIDQFLHERNRQLEDYTYMGLQAKYHNIILVFEDKTIISTINVDYTKNQKRPLKGPF